jgi:hypothetical protein
MKLRFTLILTCLFTVSAVGQTTCDKPLSACLALSAEQDKDIVALKQAVKKLENEVVEEEKSSIPAYVWVLVGGYLGGTAVFLLKK